MERTHKNMGGFQFNESGKNTEHKFKMFSNIFIHVFSETLVRENLCLNSSRKSGIYVMKRFKFSTDTRWILLWRFSKNLRAESLILFKECAERKWDFLAIFNKSQELLSLLNWFLWKKRENVWLNDTRVSERRELVNQRTSCTIWFQKSSPFTLKKKFPLTFSMYLLTRK